MKFDFKALLRRFWGWLVREGRKTGKVTVREYKKSDKDTKRLIVSVSCILLGAVFPWRWFGRLGTYIQAGLIIGGALLLFGDSKEKKKKRGFF